MARGWVGPEGKPRPSHKADLFDPKKNKGESFLHWCVGLHGGASAAGGRQAIYCGHARGQAGWPLAHLACRAKQHCLLTYGEGKVSTHQPGTPCMQAGRSASARKAREGETRAKRQTALASNRAAFALVCRRAAHSGDRSSCMSPKGRRSGSPKGGLTIYWRAQTGTLVARLPAFSLFLVAATL